MELNYGDGNTRVQIRGTQGTELLRQKYQSQQPEEHRELNLGDGITKVQTRETQGTELQ